jgi:hypothetical protein
VRSKEAESELVEVQQRPIPAKSGAKDSAERIDDPVRMYLREMGSMELLSREGEIAIAKRIEAGREAMIAGLCESPLTFQAIIIWRDELNEGKVFLRDVIDLDATYAGSDAKVMPAPLIGPDGQLIVDVAVPDQPGRLPQKVVRGNPAHPCKISPKGANIVLPPLVDCQFSGSERVGGRDKGNGGARPTLVSLHTASVTPSKGRAAFISRAIRCTVPVPAPRSLAIASIPLPARNWPWIRF